MNHMAAVKVVIKLLAGPSNCQTFFLYLSPWAVSRLIVQAGTGRQEPFLVISLALNIDRVGHLENSFDLLRVRKDSLR